MTGKLTTSERQLCLEVLNWLADRVASEIIAPKTARLPSPYRMNSAISSRYRQIWEVYQKTGTSAFADAAEAFRTAWKQWRVEVGIEPMRRMRRHGSSWRPYGKSFVPREKEPSEKQRKAVWIGSRLWFATEIARAVDRKSSYGTVTLALEHRKAHVTSDAVKVRVCEFRKTYSHRELSHLARDIFEEFARARFRRRNPKKLVELRMVGPHLTAATDQELELLEKLTGGELGASTLA